MNSGALVTELGDHDTAFFAQKLYLLPCDLGIKAVIPTRINDYSRGAFLVIIFALSLKQSITSQFVNLPFWMFSVKVGAERTEFGVYLLAISTMVFNFTLV